MTGRIYIIGLGPGDRQMITPQAQQALEAATDIIGYIPYVRRVSGRAGQTLHPSDNRVEADRARHAFSLASKGAVVAIVSSGDPGVFAMAAAVFEVLEERAFSERDIQIEVIPGITAMLAAAAAAGAPLGHDFCAINLSDNLKPFEVIEKRVRLAIDADFSMAFYNPRSSSRPHGFRRIIEVLRETCEDTRLVIFARAVSSDDQKIAAVALKDVTDDMADMRTVVIVGSSQTRTIATPSGPRIYTPRHYPSD